MVMMTLCAVCIPWSTLQKCATWAQTGPPQCRTKTQFRRRLQVRFRKKRLSRARCSEFTSVDAPINASYFLSGLDM
jgi:hypothetical protein